MYRRVFVVTVPDSDPLPITPMREQNKVNTEKSLEPNTCTVNLGLHILKISIKQNVYMRLIHIYFWVIYK